MVLNKLLFLLIVFCLGLVIFAGAHTEVEKASLEERISTLENVVETLDKTVQAFHEPAQFRPPENVVETWVRVRTALRACGCEIQ